MREKFIRFMNGRNGMDELARAESWVVMILLVVSIFTRSAILDILAIGLMIHMYFRVFSRNVNKRYAENQKFLGSSTSSSSVLCASRRSGCQEDMARSVLPVRSAGSSS